MLQTIQRRYYIIGVWVLGCITILLYCLERQDIFSIKVHLQHPTDIVRLWSSSFGECDDTSEKWRRYLANDVINVTSQVWLRTDAVTELFVYSAYYDVDNGPLIRVIGAGGRTDDHHVLCLVQWSAHSACLAERSATVKILPENNWKR